jgi:hypothetical protein
MHIITNILASECNNFLNKNTNVSYILLEGVGMGEGEGVRVRGRVIIH